MAEFDFEIPRRALNTLMDRVVARGLFLRWLFLNEERDTLAVRLKVPDVEVEEVLLELSEVLEDPLEVSVIGGTEFHKTVNQAFIASVEVGEEKYPVVVFMEFDFNPRVPSKVTILMRPDSPEDVVRAVLRTKIGPFTLQDPSSTKIIEDKRMAKILVTSPLKTWA